MKNSLAKKIGIGLTVGGIIFGASSLNADAQRQKYPKRHLWGDYFTIDKSGKKWNLEEKVFYPGERILYQETEISEKNELGMIGYDAHKLKLVLDGKTKEPEALKSDKQIIYKQVGTSLKLSTKGKYGLRAGGLCDIQIEEKAGVSKGEAGYIAPVNIKDFLPDIRTVVLNGVEYFWPIVAEDKLNEEGKTKHYLIRKDSADIVVDYADKSITFEGKIYRGIEQELEEEKVIPITPGQGTKLSAKRIKRKEPTDSAKVKKPKSADFYFIGGANGNKDFWEGFAGAQIGPVAIVGNYGQGQDAVTLEGTTDPSPITGRYVGVKEWDQDIKLIGISGEIHPLSNKKVSPFAGGGINNWNYTENKSMTMFGRNGQQLGSDSESKAISENSWKGYGGINFKVGEKSKLGIQSGYDSKAKFFAGARYTLKLGK